MLTRDHHDALRASGISDDVIIERGYESLLDGRRLIYVEKYSFESWQVNSSGLYVPLYDHTGEQVSCQFRPDNPRERAGRTIKYETPFGASNVLDVHPRNTPYLNDPNVDAVVCEGCKKADALTSRGYFAIALAGVWSWRSRGAPLIDFESIEWAGRRVWIYFDSDLRTNWLIRLAATRLRELLLSLNAHEVFIAVPPLADNALKKVGLDDWLVQGRSLNELVQVAPCATLLEMIRSFA